jgi:hypothetical protein
MYKYVTVRSMLPITYHTFYFVLLPVCKEGLHNTLNGAGNTGKN